jgi:predicted RNA-binding protein with PUA domain
VMFVSRDGEDGEAGHCNLIHGCRKVNVPLIVNSVHLCRGDKVKVKVTL